MLQTDSAFSALTLYLWCLRMANHLHGQSKAHALFLASCSFQSLDVSVFGKLGSQVALYVHGRGGNYKGLVLPANVICCKLLDCLLYLGHFPTSYFTVTPQFFARHSYLLDSCIA